MSETRNMNNDLEILLQKLCKLRVLRSTCEDSNDGSFRVHLNEKEWNDLWKTVESIRGNRQDQHN